MPPSLDGGPPASFCAPFLEALPVDRVAIATLGDPFEVRTVCATDDLAARFNELELDYGEGPSWQTRITHAPVLTPDLRTGDTTAWPVLAGALAEYPLRSVYAFPIAIGVLSLGAVDLYSEASDVLDAADVELAASLATSAALGMLRDAVTALELPSESRGVDRRAVHQATGMVVAQLRVSPDDALLVIRGHAFSESRPVAAVAVDIVERRLAFEG